MSKKGITPIVSVVLLLLVTIALAGGVLVWLTGYVGGLQGDFTVKGTACQRVDANNVTFRGYIRNIKDDVLSNGSVTVTVLGGPGEVDLSKSYLPHGDLDAGAQKLFTITATNPTGVERGSYTLELAGNAIERVTFNCK